MVGSRRRRQAWSIAATAASSVSPRRRGTGLERQHLQIVVQHHPVPGTGGDPRMRGHDGAALEHDPIPNPTRPREPSDGTKTQVGPDQTVTTTPASRTWGQTRPSRWGRINLSWSSQTDSWSPRGARRLIPRGAQTHLSTSSLAAHGEAWRGRTWRHPAPQRGRVAWNAAVWMGTTGWPEEAVDDQATVRVVTRHECTPQRANSICGTETPALRPRLRCGVGGPLHPPDARCYGRATLATICCW